MRGVLVAALAVVLATGALFGCATAEKTTTTTTERVTTTTRPSVDKSKFADVWRAIVKIESATAVGVTYRDLGALVQNLVTEVSLLPQDMNTSESELQLAVLRIAMAYNDSLILWERKLDQSDSIAYGGIAIRRDGKPLIDRAREMVDAYALDLEPSTSMSGYEVVPDESIQQIWMWASESSDAIRPDIAP